MSVAVGPLVVSVAGVVSGAAGVRSIATIGLRRGVDCGVPWSLSCRRMPSPSDPLLLWCSSHESLAAEEIPLFLEAGFRVVPLHTNFWTQEYDSALDATICPAWRESVALPPDVVRALQAVRVCQPDKHPAFSTDDLALLARHVDAVYVTVFPNVAIRLAEEFPRTVMFRAFGHAGLNTYSRIAAAVSPATVAEPHEQRNLLFGDAAARSPEVAKVFADMRAELDRLRALYEDDGAERTALGVKTVGGAIALAK